MGRPAGNGGTVAGRQAGCCLEDVFADYKQRELANFCRIRDDRLRSAWQDQHGIWLIIAVTMCDLFKDRLNEARDYYIPTSRSCAPRRRKLRRTLR